eukprot:1835997-Rhodomonas_salina.6
MSERSSIADSSKLDTSTVTNMHSRFWEAPNIANASESIGWSYLQRLGEQTFLDSPTSCVEQLSIASDHVDDVHANCVTPTEVDPVVAKALANGKLCTFGKRKFNRNSVDLQCYCAWLAIKLVSETAIDPSWAVSLHIIAEQLPSTRNNEYWSALAQHILNDPGGYGVLLLLGQSKSTICQCHAVPNVTLQMCSISGELSCS